MHPQSRLQVLKQATTICYLQVYLSHNKPRLGTVLPSNVEQVSGLKSVKGNCATLNDDTTCSIDDVIFCTGYKYKFDFLPPDVVQVEDKLVKPLYRQMVNINYPDSLFFLGMNFAYIIGVLSQCHRQALCISKILSGEIVLPEKEIMEAEFRADVAKMPAGLARYVPVTISSTHVRGRGGFKGQFSANHFQLFIRFFLIVCTTL